MKQFGGPVIFLDRSDINTDEIIPAKYLTEVEKAALAPHCLEDLSLEGFDPSGDALRRATVIVTRANFGCGSSREHAPWALEVNDITVVVAQSFARIFRQNMFNCGMMAIEIPEETIDGLFEFGRGGSVDCSVDYTGRKLLFSRGDGGSMQVGFSLSEFDSALVKAGGWVEFADARY
ncbi:MAG: 3-isopropylmalate dehydratase small subunit [Chitinivibrionales bacterium]|nr:3-isopropylmalate dehydratase small subunit [Chitinivibrionales bacterium]